MKKETYFTPQTIFQKSRDMLELLDSFRKHHGNIAFESGSAALLVLDMQEYFLREDSHAFVPSAPAILPNIQLLIAAFHAWNRPVIFSRHVNSQEDAGMMSVWWRDLIRGESLESEITPALDPSNGIIIRKSQYDAFYGSPLEQTLRENKVDQVVICGVMTHLCCESTARSAFMRGFNVFFTIDGTATYTEAFHRATLLNLAHGFAVPVLASEMLNGYYRK
jgi:bifunctional isochorismate lyase/aryl carrier protein